MLFTRERLEQIEDSALAPYGMRSRDSRGRVFADQQQDEEGCSDLFEFHGMHFISSGLAIVVVNSLVEPAI